MEKTKEERKDIGKIFSEGRQALADLAFKLPHQPRTNGQRSLMGMHGTPYQFAHACLDSFKKLEITFEEAEKAILKYRDEWEKA